MLKIEELSHRRDHMRFRNAPMPQRGKNTVRPKIMHTAPALLCFVEVNTSRPRQNGRHIPYIFKCAFLNENV